MKTWIVGLSLAALAAGSAYAVESQRPSPDRDGNGILTRSEAEARAAALFARVDVNKDGKIDAADRTARREIRFNTIDADKDGQISRAEFAAPRARAEIGAEIGGGRGPHRMGDRNGHRHGMGPHPRGGMALRMADTNQDGAITSAEFTAAALQRFDRTDVNKDGRITQEERRAIRQLGRQRAAPPPLTPPVD